MEDTASPKRNPELESPVRQLRKNLAGLKKAFDEWDFAGFRKFVTAFRESMRQIAECGPTELERLEQEIEEKQRRLETASFREDLERALREAKLPLQGEFPKYDIPPFRMEVDIATRSIRLVFGRRSKRSNSFAPDSLAKWVQKRYQAVVKRSFDANQFADELLAAYEVASELAYRKVLWDRAVPLQRLYELLTLRGDSRTEYPLAYFAFDLARFRRSDMVFNGRRFEFGYSRDVGHTILVPDQDGREDRLSSLTIYDRRG